MHISIRIASIALTLNKSRFILVIPHLLRFSYANHHRCLLHVISVRGHELSHFHNFQRALKALIPTSIQLIKPTS